MSVKVKRSGEPMEKTLMKKVRATIDIIVPVVIGMIQRRTAKGKDSKGGTFAPYTRSYEETLREGGELPRVDLTLTGGYLASITERSRTETGTLIRVTIGPGTGTSPKVTAKNGHMRPTGDRSPPYNILGGYLENGTPHMRARPHLGLTADERKRVAEHIARLLKK